MGQAEELLKRAASTWTTRPDTEPHIVIDEDRFITIPDELKRIAVEGDHNIETVTFDCPRYWDGHDLSEMQIYINYMRPDKTVGSHIAENVRMDEEDDAIIHFDWTISNHVSEFKGKILFLVCAKKIGDVEIGEYEYEAGEKWLVAGETPDFITNIVWSGLYDFIGIGNSTTVFESSDGMTWTQHSSNTSVRRIRVYNIAGFDSVIGDGYGGIYSYGYNGNWGVSYAPNCLLTNSDYKRYHFTHCNSTGRSVAVLTTDSDDGDRICSIAYTDNFSRNEWVSCDVTLPGYCVTIESNDNGEFILVTSGRTSTDPDNIYYSADGITWSLTHSITDTNFSMYGAAYGNDRFILLTSKGTYWSTDGKTWNEGWKLPDKDIASSLHFINDMFVVNYKKTIYYSMDGIEWTQFGEVDLHNHQLNGICYDSINNMYVSTGVLNGVYSSFYSMDHTSPIYESQIIHHWNSEINEQMTISEGLEAGETIIDAHPDIFAQLIDRMDDIEKAYEDFVGIDYASDSDIDDIINGNHIDSDEV